ncbi:Imm21 family immunity protein [Streptomyces sp. DT224]|uniref:Imm21 family immunity protein n=1 Tax=Streptomyces sp. DT224 TaxID=3393426 RepID=UPI003CF59696
MAAGSGDVDLAVQVYVRPGCPNHAVLHERILPDPATVWEECGTWSSDGPAVLMVRPGLAYPGGGTPAAASVSLPAGRWRVRATHTKADEETCVGLVQLLSRRRF